MAVRKGLKVNEYGVFKGKKRVAGRTEKDVYATVGLPYIEPEMRENTGEIEAARKGRLPKLITLDDIKGDLHVHSKATDGRYSIAEMAAAAEQEGYHYIAITDHSKHVTVANGLDAKRLAAQIKEIDKLNAKLKGFTILKSVEVDILKDGTLDLPDSILKELDLVVAAVHYKFDLPRADQTKRVLKAMENPYLSILAHPTGRLLGQRDAYEIDMEAVMKSARKQGIALEINAQPERLDLDGARAKMATEMGVKLVISTDAHTTQMLDFMRFGISEARRGWVEAKDVLNTRNFTDLKKLLKRG